MRDLAADFILALPPEGLTAPLAGPNDITLLPGKTQGIAHLQRRGFFLSVQAGPYPLFSAERPAGAETLHLVADEQIALLRDLLSHAWTRSDTGATLQPGDLSIRQGPVLMLAGEAFPLADVLPGAAPDALTLGALTLNRVPGSRALPRDIALRPQGPAGTPDAADEAAFAVTSPARLSIPAPPELAIPPLLGSLADRDFLYRRCAAGLAPVSGRRHWQSQIVRASAKFVVLEGAAFGMILDEHGVLRQACDPGAAMPPFISAEGEQSFVDRALLDAAPMLAGPHAVFCGPGFAEYDGWLINSMLPLSLIAPYLPAGTTLLLPRAPARARTALDCAAMLDAFGFAGKPRLEMADCICKVEELYWPDRCTIEQLPAAALQAARARVIGRRPAASGARTRIYVRRKTARMVANAFVVESILTKQGFTPVVMEDLTVTEQIDLFRHAEMVVAGHGAALANLIFCPAGTQVIELSPDCEYRPLFNTICGKLGLTHAVLPCATDDGSFDGKMNVPAPRLTALLGILMSRQAA